MFCHAFNQSAVYLRISATAVRQFTNRWCLQLDEVKSSEFKMNPQETEVIWLGSRSTAWVKKSPLIFSDIFSKGVFGPNFTHLLYVLVYTRLQIFIQLSPTLTKLCHIKPDHRYMLKMSTIGWKLKRTRHAEWSHLIWHNFVKFGDNWIKICSLA